MQEQDINQSMQACTSDLSRLMLHSIPPLAYDLHHCTLAHTACSRRDNIVLVMNRQDTALIIIQVVNATMRLRQTCDQNQLMLLAFEFSKRNEYPEIKGSL